MESLVSEMRSILVIVVSARWLDPSSEKAEDGKETHVLSEFCSL